MLLCEIGAFIFFKILLILEKDFERYDNSRICVNTLAFNHDLIIAVNLISALAQAATMRGNEGSDANKRTRAGRGTSDLLIFPA